jgi:serine/threonine-protein kinase
VTPGTFDPDPRNYDGSMKSFRLAIVGVCILAAGSAFAEPPPRFPASSVWHQDISSAPVHPSSATMISTLAGLGGFGLGRMQIDFSLHVVHAPPGSPTRTTVSHPWGYYDPDCEPLGTEIPVPDWAAIEGETGLSCDNLSNDCHLLVVQGDTLYEAYLADAPTAGELETHCLAVWHLGAVYPPEGRGEHCTSADAAGFPMAALVFNADEIQASLDADPTGGGDLGHAIRFILPNDRMASDHSLPGAVSGRLYVRPASHAGGPSGPTASVPYGARLRLKDTFAINAYPPPARVVLNTFARYGIVLADGGSVALTAESDLFTDTSWDDLGFGPHTFAQSSGPPQVTVEDFEVIDTGSRIAETYDCVRTTVDPWLFADGFESGDTSAWAP